MIGNINNFLAQITQLLNAYKYTLGLACFERNILHNKSTASCSYSKKYSFKNCLL